MSVIIQNYFIKYVYTYTYVVYVRNWSEEKLILKLLHDYVRNLMD